MKFHNHQRPLTCHFQLSALLLLFLILTAQQDAKIVKTEETGQFNSALKGKSYFEPSQPLVVPEKGKKCPVVSSCGSASESSTSCSITESSSCSYTKTSSSTSSTDCSQINSDSRSYSISDSCSSSSSSSSSSSFNPLRRARARPVARANFQVPWCPGQVMASIVPIAMDPIYDWNLEGTCQQFADNFGGVSVIVGELGGPDFCSAGPNPGIYSNYTITRGLSVNEAIYARVMDQGSGIEYAAAAGPILYPNGLVMYISVVKEVSKLPQVCS